jgi:hypothetical protein
MCEGILIAVSALGAWTGAALIGSGRVVSSGAVICCGTVVCLEGDISPVYVTDCVLPGALTIVEAAVNVATGLARLRAKRFVLRSADDCARIASWCSRLLYH